MVRAAALIASFCGPVALMLAGCNDPSPTPGKAQAESPRSTAQVAAPTLPAHRWQYREGKEYGYSAVLSEDDVKSGKGAAEVQMFRFLGQKDGVYRVAHSEGGSTMTASCANPCQVIKVVVSTPFGAQTQRIEFKADTVIGGVLTDAFSGQLEAYAPPPVRRRASKETCRADPSNKEYEICSSVSDD